MTMIKIQVIPTMKLMLEDSSNIDQDGSIDTIDSFDFFSMF